MSREGGKILLTSKENHVCGCFVLETTDLRESVENDRVSPRTQDGHRSINGNVHLQFRAFLKLSARVFSSEMHFEFLYTRRASSAWRAWADTAPGGDSIPLSPDDWLGGAPTCQDAGSSTKYSQGPRA